VTVRRMAISSVIIVVLVAALLHTCTALQLRGAFGHRQGNKYRLLMEEDQTCLRLGLGTGENRLLDLDTKRQLMSSPKAGATVITKIFFDTLGITQKANDYSLQKYHRVVAGTLKPFPWIHDYEVDVFNFQPKHDVRHNGCIRVCSKPGFSCVKIIRSPLSRAVSSYVHTLKYLPDLDEHFHELEEYLGPDHGNASFVDFLAALKIKAAKSDAKPRDGKHSKNGMQDHFMPQFSSCDRIVKPALVPIEFLGAGLAQFGNHTGKQFKYSKTDSKSAHFIKKESGIYEDDVAEWKAYRFGDRMGHVPEYKHFYKSKAVQRQVRCLFHHDFQMYRRACSQTWLLTDCAECAETCAKEILRMDEFDMA